MDEHVWITTIRQLLAVRGMSQSDLVRKGNIRPTTVSNIMQNHTSPRLNTMEAIAGALEIPLWRLFMDERQASLLTQQQEADQRRHLKQKKRRLRSRSGY